MLGRYFTSVDLTPGNSGGPLVTTIPDQQTSQPQAVWVGLSQSINAEKQENYATAASSAQKLLVSEQYSKPYGGTPLELEVIQYRPTQ